MRRGSLAHGTPPNINPNYYDVPMPTLEDLNPPSAHRLYMRSSKCFIALCQLTEILHKILPLVYSLRGEPSREIHKIVRSIEMELDQWEDDLPYEVQILPRTNVRASGTCSLHLCLLSLKMLACRISLHVSWIRAFAFNIASKRRDILTFVTI